MAGDARIDAFIVGVGRVLKLDAALAQRVDGAIDAVGSERDVLDALALVLVEVFLDLALIVLALVDGDAYFSAGRGQRPRKQAGFLALDAEIADFLEVE